MMQQGREAWARDSAVDRSLVVMEEEEGGGSVTVVLKIPAASAAAAAIIILPQLPSHPFGFVTHTLT